MSRFRLLLVLLGSTGVSVTAAQDAESPDLALLEYLGSWDDSDEEWLVVAEELMGMPVGGGQNPPEAAAESENRSEASAEDPVAAGMAEDTAPAGDDDNEVDENDEN